MAEGLGIRVATWALFRVVFTVVACAAWGCDRPDVRAKASPATAPATPATAPASAAPKNNLLLLDDGPARVAAESEADNSRCHVCHLNFAMEDLAVKHARVNIGCAKCHGESDAHIDDESWASGGNGTAPDVMFTLEKVNPFCLGCHPKDKLSPEQHAPVLAGTSEKKHCTDCHGKHRMVSRRCKWK